MEHEANWRERGSTWNIPCDRELKLLSKLDYGWSSISRQHFLPEHFHEDQQWEYKDEMNTEKVQEEEHFHLQHDAIDETSGIMKITPSEYEQIQSVLQRNDALQRQDHLRIQTLQKKCEGVKMRQLGDGINSCIACGNKEPTVLACCDDFHICVKCGKLACGKCSVVCSSAHQDNPVQTFLCVICHQDDILWKHSGAWFYKFVPKVTEKKRKLTMKKQKKVSASWTDDYAETDDSDSNSLEAEDEMVLSTHSINNVFRKMMLKKYPSFGDSSSSLVRSSPVVTQKEKDL